MNRAERMLWTGQTGGQPMEPADSKEGRLLNRVDLVTLIVVVALVLLISAALVVILF